MAEICGGRGALFELEQDCAKGMEGSVLDELRCIQKE